MGMQIFEAITECSFCSLVFSVSTSDVLSIVFGLTATVLAAGAIWVTRQQHTPQGKHKLFLTPILESRNYLSGCTHNSVFGYTRSAPTERRPNSLRADSLVLASTSTYAPSASA
jgi:hypothetical protein